ERELKQLISDKTKRLIKFNIAERPIDEIGEAENEIKKLFSQLKELQAEIKQKNPHYTNFSELKAFNLKQIQEQILDPDTVLLEYSLGNEQSYLWLVTQTEVKSFSLPKRSEIESLAKYLQELITARNLLAKGENIGGRPMTLESAANEYPKVANELSKALLSPVAQELGKKRLVIIPDGALQYIPFNALPEPNKTDNYQPLLVEHEIVSLPSAATISVLRQEYRENKENKEKAKTVMFIADPVFSPIDSRVKNQSLQTMDKRLAELEESNLLIKKSAKEIGLPLTNQGFPKFNVVSDEIKQISELLSAEENKQMLSFNASLSNLNKESSSYRVIHFATYGLANSQHPELSGLVLSLTDEQGKLQDGFLQIHKIFNLNLPTELVTLSNCDMRIAKTYS
ncbi:MAG: hypothetical protein FD167_5503, partial [bacterium]